MFRGLEKTLLAAIVLFAASAASALPTDALQTVACSSVDTFRSQAMFPSVAADVTSGQTAGQLRDIGKAILQPPAGGLAGNNVQAGNFKPLPGAPAAVLMGLIGFLCVSAGRDRKAWLAVFSCALWLGQQGVQLVPRLIQYADHGTSNGREYTSQLYSRSQFAQSHNGYRDLAAQYVGLLHHLAGIPNGRTTLVKTLLTDTENVSGGSPVLAHAFCAEMDDYCSVSGTGQFVCFTPAFIFLNMPRGPPIST